MKIVQISVAGSLNDIYQTKNAVRSLLPHYSCSAAQNKADNPAQPKKTNKTNIQKMKIKNEISKSERDA